MGRSMTNQVQIPLLHHEDSIVTQIQQNTNKVFKNFSNQTAGLRDLIQSMIIVGEVKEAALTIDQFQAVAGTEWILCNGQSCVDTDYSRLTGNNVVPNITPVSGTNFFIRVN